MASELPALPPAPSFDAVKESQKVIEYQMRYLTNEIKQLKADAKQFSSKQSADYTSLDEIKRKQAEVNAKIKELSTRTKALEEVFKDPAIEEIKKRIKPLPLDKAKIEERIKQVDTAFYHTALSAVYEKYARYDLANLYKALLEVEKIDFEAIEAARREFNELMGEKKPLLEERISLRARFDEEMQSIKQIRDENKEVKSEADGIWVQIKQKQAEHDKLWEQHAKIYEEFQARRKEYDGIRKLHDEARAANQERRKVLEPIVKKLQEHSVRYQENPLYSGKYDIQTPDYAALIDAPDEEFNRAYLAQWIDIQLATVAKEGQVAAPSAKATKDVELQQFAKQPKQPKKEKKQKDKYFVDYSGFEFFGACGIKFSDYDTPEKLAELREQLRNGNQQLKQQKLDQAKQKVEAILAELTEHGGEWKWVDKVEFVKREFAPKKNFDKNDGDRKGDRRHDRERPEGGKNRSKPSEEAKPQHAAEHADE